MEVVILLHNQVVTLNWNWGSISLEFATEAAEKRNLPLKVIKLDTMEKAQSSPTPATIFSLFYNGNFVTTDLSVCMDSRFDKVMEKR